MGKSYKKHGHCCYVKKDSEMKRIFNRRIRRIPIDFIEGVSTLADGGAYRKANEPWEICDCQGLAPSFSNYWGTYREYRKFYFCK